MNKKEKRCKNYLGVNCFNGNCPIQLYYENSIKFERKPTCKKCAYNKGCENCYLQQKRLCVKVGDKNG